MSEYEIPEPLVEAGARALCASVCGDGMWDAHKPGTREQYRMEVRMVLTAVLGVCEVREEWRRRWPDLAVSVWDDEDPRPFPAATVQRRLAITTPAEEVAS